MKIFKLLVPTLSLVGIMTYTASALADPVTIVDLTTSLSATNPKELGRLSRSGVPSSFGSTKAFPGLLNTTTSYTYETITFNSSLFSGGQNVEVSLFDYGNTGDLFAAAYATSYNPLSPLTNYLGDLGSSPDSFGTNAGYFEFVLAPNTNLVLLVNETLGGANSALLFGDPFELVVQHSATDPTGDPYGDPTPEPSSLVLLGTGALGLIGVAGEDFQRRQLSKGRKHRQRPGFAETTLRETRASLLSKKAKRSPISVPDQGNA